MSPSPWQDSLQRLEGRERDVHGHVDEPLVEQQPHVLTAVRAQQRPEAVFGLGEGIASVAVLQQTGAEGCCAGIMLFLQSGEGWTIT